MATPLLEDRVIKKTLPNGLTVLITEDHTSPIVAVNMWFGVGSVNETEEMNGLAHFQEHMVFKGTEKYGVGEIANIVKSAGGNLNAGTSYSYTMYYIVLPSREFDTALEVQADAMMHSTFDPDEFQKERIVVMDEARMYDDRPDSFTFYRTMELGFQRHTYRRPIAGYGHIVEKITRDQLLDFYNNYYRPTNAVLVIVGDVDADRAIARAQEVYGGWENGPVNVNEPPAEPPQESFRYQAHSGTMDHGYLGAGFHVPSILHEDYPALEMLSELLSSGRSSRLYQRVLEEKRLVTSVNASLLAEKWPGFFLVMASMPPQKWNEARAAVFAEIERFKHEPVHDAELQKARRQIERSMYRELETMEGQASNLGYYQLLGDYRLADRHREAVSKVTPEQLMAVARRYFHPDNCSLVSYMPDDAPALDAADVEAAMRASLSSEGGVTDVDTGGVETVTLPDDTPAQKRREAKAPDDQPPQLFRLDNGTRVVLKRRTTVPMVSVLTVFPGGSRYEPAGKSGLATLTHRAIIKGTEKYEAEEITERIESLGGSIESFGSFDTSGVYMSVISEHLGDALEIYNDVVRRPRFDGERVSREKERALEELGKRHDNPVHLAMDALFRDVFGDHPYAWPFFGEREQAAALEGRDCSSWYRSLLVPDSAVVAIVGDIDQDGASAVAQQLLGDLPAAKAAPSPVFEMGDKPVSPGVHVLRKKNLKQAVTFVGYTAPPMLSEEALALDVLNGVLSGLGGRLFVELRDKRSLGYMTGSAFNSLFDRSIFFGYANPAPDRVDEAVDVIHAELDKVTREIVTEEEFERSREWLIGSQLMQLQRNGSQANAYGAYEALGFGLGVVDRIPDLIRAVTRETIRETAEKVFVPENAAIVKLLPED